MEAARGTDGSADLATLTRADVEPVFLAPRQAEPQLAIDESLLRDSLAELNGRIGLREIKEEIDEMVALARYYRETGRPLRTLLAHTVFTGNPGTGKTTVARILSRIYRALGLLERGDLVECDRQGLVAGYIGQTARRTLDRIEEAMGGMLFIDEAYALARGGDRDFGHEAIETLLKQMEDRRGRFCVVVAGYTEEMGEFLASNPGLESRFDRVFHFDDYDPGQLARIARSILAERGLVVDAGATEHLGRCLEGMWRARDRTFGNGRAVRSWIEQAVRRQDVRLARMPAADRTPERMRTITAEDLAGPPQRTGSPAPRRPIGFKQEESNGTRRREVARPHRPRPPR